MQVARRRVPRIRKIRRVQPGSPHEAYYRHPGPFFKSWGMVLQPDDRTLFALADNVDLLVDLRSAGLLQVRDIVNNGPAHQVDPVREVEDL